MLHLCWREHVQKDCWYGGTKGCKGKGKQKGNGKGKKGKDKNNPVTEVRQDDSQSSSSSQIIANFTSEWIFAVARADNWEKYHVSEAEILLDSGAYDHVCSPDFVTRRPLHDWIEEWCATPMAVKYQPMDEGWPNFNLRTDRQLRWSSRS